MSFSFIDDKNKILDIDPSQNYYLAGKNQDVLFISKTFNISDGIITFDVDTYTEPFLNEVQKRNTEIQIELGYNTLGVQKVLLRDYAFAQPRVYIEGLNPSKVDLSDYYTKGEVDSLLANIDVNVSLDNYYTKAEVDEKISEPTDLSNYYTKDQVDNLIPDIPEIPEVPTKVSDLQNDSGFISTYTETDPIYTADKPNIALKLVNESVIDGASIDILGGKRFLFDGDVTNFIINSIEDSNIESEVWFSCQTSSPTISYPDTLIWLNEPIFEVGNSYIINIRNNVAVYGSYPIEG